jgi:hypothetical protein
MTNTTKNPHVQFSGNKRSWDFIRSLADRLADDDALHAMIAKAGDVETLLAIHAQCVEDQDWANWAEIEAAGMQAAWDAIKDDCDQSRLERIEDAFYDCICIDFYA